MHYIIALYEIDRIFGGPEEGSWWVDTGTLARPLRVCRTHACALAAANRANRILDRLQRHRRDTGSVLYEGGRLRACVFEGRLPDRYPEERPTYE